MDKILIVFSTHFEAFTALRTVLGWYKAWIECMSTEVMRLLGNIVTDRQEDANARMEN